MAGDSPHSQGVHAAAIRVVSDSLESAIPLIKDGRPRYALQAVERAEQWIARCLSAIAGAAPGSRPLVVGMDELLAIHVHVCDAIEYFRSGQIDDAATACRLAHRLALKAAQASEAAAHATDWHGLPEEEAPCGTR